MSVHSLLHSVAHALDVKLLGIGDHAVPQGRALHRPHVDPTDDSIVAFLERERLRKLA